MSSKTIDSSTVRQYQLHLIMSEQSQSIANNTTTIAYELRLTSGNYNFQQYGAGWAVWINGTRVAYHDRNTSDRYSISKNSSWSIASGTTTVTHNTDGTKTITCSASLDMAGDPAPGALSCPSTSWTLTTIPRASTLSVPTLTIGSASTLTVTAASNTFTHQITYSFSGLTGTIATLNAGVSTTSWTPPNTFYAKLPNSTSGTVAITLKTYSGATEIGSNTYNATVNVGTSIKPTAPTVTLQPVNTNAWINSQGLYVGGYSAVKVTSSATAGTGASMSSYTISGAISGTGSPYTSGILSAGAKSITVTATDSRGRTNSSTTSVTFLTYTYPGLTTFTADRGTYSGGSWTSNVNGDHIRITAVPSVSLSANGNTGTVTVKIGASNPDATSGNYYYFTTTSATQSYSVTGSVTDSVGNTTSRGLTVPTIEVPLNINVDLPGIGVGMIAQTAHNFEVAPAWSVVADGKNNRFNYMPYSFVTTGGSNTAGYARIATFQINGTWNYTANNFLIQRLTDKRPITLSLFFRSDANTTPVDIELHYDSLQGVNSSYPFDAFVYSPSASVLDVYVKKVSGSDIITVTSQISGYTQTKCVITYSDALLSSIPPGAISATPTPALVNGRAFTKSSGNASIDSIALQRQGALCIVTFRVYGSSSDIGAGTNAWVGTTNLPKPAYPVSAAAYSGSSCLVAYFNAGGTLTVRVTGQTFTAGSDTSRFCLVYFTEENLP